MPFALNLRSRIRLFAWLLAVTVLSGPALSDDYSRGPAGDADRLSFVQVNGVRLAYRVEGAGVPVVFVHGESYTHELWTEQIEAFSDKHLFLSYDRRGHGQSEDPVTGYSETAHAQDLDALLNYLGISDAHFVVNSRGGSIVIRYLKLFGDKVRSITFADATIPLVPIPEESAFAPVVPRLFGPPPTLEQALAGREGAKRSPFTRIAQSRPEVRMLFHRMLDQYSPLVAMNPQRSDMAGATHIGPWNPRDFPDMHEMHQPILLIVAEQGDAFFIEGARQAHRLWPNTRFHVMPNVDHLLMLEEPAAFNTMVLDFLAEVDDIIAARALD
ncbi:MAG: alpha/beta hydrolase [Xanthomonadales bacterium]|nr:alpha/beta hydrolase [Xanthomonadales bacterium]